MYGAGKLTWFVGDYRIPRFIILEYLELLDTQKELEEELHRGKREHTGECTGMVTEYKEYWEPEEK